MTPSIDIFSYHAPHLLKDGVLGRPCWMNCPYRLSNFFNTLYPLRAPTLARLGIHKAAVVERQILLCLDTHLLVKLKIVSKDLEICDATFRTVRAVNGETARIY